jgi:hypothetical protein
MKKKYSPLVMAAMMALIQEDANFTEGNKTIEYKPIEKRKKEIPKGCEEYHFTRSGHYDTTDNTWNDIDYIFSCIASNSKVAVKKFNAFMRSNQAE